MAGGLRTLAEPADPMFGGLSVGAWFEVFWDTHCANGMGGVVRVEWPEPGGYAAQPAIAVMALRAVQCEVLEAAEAERNRVGNG